ncbi:MAG TPA: NAD(P)H-hydrate dehydratase [Lachnospiraceae bacterium]|nr:NAD(P)H-hydrate dehydratase [Lachnospiraceae bacterium]
MKNIVTAAQMKECDRDTITNLGIPSLVLMERAALGIAEEVLGYLIVSGKEKTGRVLCVCGTGNNGGDGIACARILFMKGINTEIFYTGEPDKGTPETVKEAEIAENLQIPVVSEPHFQVYDVIVDAIFGIGLSRDLGGIYKETVEKINLSGAFIVAADISSGIDADTGRIHGTAVKADKTVTMQYEKAGQIFYPGAKYSGKVSVLDIGIREKLTGPRQKELTEEDIPGLLKKRDPAGNKGTFGKVLIIAGSKNMSGASYFAGLAALRTGAGMVRLLTEESNREIIQKQLPEVMLETWTNADEAVKEIERNLSWADAIAAGPGLGKSETVKKIIAYLLENAGLPLVLDADGLNALEGNSALLRGRKAEIFVTPHIGEMSRLTGSAIEEIKADPLRAARDLSLLCGIHCILKDARTCIAEPDGTVYINTTGNDGMATAGSGDTLTGMLSSLLAQGTSCDIAGALAVYLHGAAGDLAAAENGPSYMIASDIILQIKNVLRRYGR